MALTTSGRTLVGGEPPREPSPLVVFRPDGSRGLRVVVCCERAEARGVRAGLTVAEAYALLDGPTGRERAAASGDMARYVEADGPADLAALRALAGSCLRHGPQIALEAAGPSDATGPEGFFLSADAAHLFQGELSWAARVGRDLAGRGYAVRGAIACTAGAAWALARHATRPVRGRRIVVCPPDRLAERLAPLPVASLRLPADVLEVLAELDVRTVADLTRLPRAALPSRLGPAVLERIDQAHGREPEPLAYETFTDPPAAGHAFEEPLAERQVLAVVVERLTARVARELAPLGRGVVRLAVDLTDTDGERSGLTVGFLRPTGRLAHLWEIVLGRLERVKLPASVVAVTVRVVESGPLTTRQARLSDRGTGAMTAVEDSPAADGGAPPEEDDRSLARLVDRLSGRLGETRVVRPSVRPETQPERMIAYRSWIPDGSISYPTPSSPRRPPSVPPPLPGLPPESADVWRMRAEPDALADLPFVVPTGRPLHLHPEPLPIVVDASDGRPVSIRLASRFQAVTVAHGPERIETGWWRERTVRRDYWRLTLTDGREIWIFHDSDAGTWFLHGEYA